VNETKFISPKIEIPYDKIAEFCHKWKVSEFALFGSVLRDDFRSDSDIDVLVRFAPDARRGLFVLVDMQDELEGIFGRKAHLATLGSIEASHNPLRRRSILDSARVIHAA
jgi:uncharacterized protein